MIRRLFAAVVGTVGLMGAPSLGQLTGEEGSAPARLLTRADLIERVVEGLNARGVAHVPEIGESGDLVTWQGPAAWTTRNPDAGLGGPCRVDVALVAADTAVNVADVSAKLLMDARIASVTVVSTTTVTPTFDELQVFDSVLVWTNSTPLDSVALGDNLADFVDSGGGVVLSMFAMRASLAGRTIQGRFLSDNYYAIEHSIGGSTTGAATLGAVPIPGSPVMSGVASFDGGALAFRSPAPLNLFAARVADWSTGEILVATRDDLSGRRIDLGFWPVSNTVASNGWIATTGGGRLLANALVYAGGCPDAGLGGCAGAFVAHAPNLSLDGRNSNTASNAGTTQQEADDFRISGGATIRTITLWGAYALNTDVPACQRFIINIHANAAGDPGPIVHTAAAIAVPEYTGEHIAGLSDARLYRFTIDLDRPFTAGAGVTYWLSPLGNNSGNIWAWQFSSTTGTRRFKLNAGSGWTEATGGFAFNLCGEDCEADFNDDGTVNSQDFFDFLTAFFAGC